jgi:MFS family permease
MKFRPQWTFLGFFFVFELGSLICGLAKSSAMLIVGRVIAGFGTSGILNGALLIISECAPMHKRPSMLQLFPGFAYSPITVAALIGIVMGIGQLGLASGPLFGGLLTQYATWR